MVLSKFKVKKRLGILCLLLSITLIAGAQRKMEVLDRGLVAVQTDDGVFLSWRLFGTEWYGVNYNVYRDGIQINTSPLSVSNFIDNSGTSNSNYTVAAIVDGTELEQSSSVAPQDQQYREIKLKTRNTAHYEINDGTAADLDGDGEYELIIKRLNKDYTVGNDTVYSYFEAYEMDGTFLWEINVGPNILSSSGVEINIAAFDLDEDGKAEVFMRTSEGTIFGDGTEIGDVDGDGRTNYRYSVLQTANMQYMCAGPEFLSLIDGETGIELDRVDFIPRINADWWGDGYGHRANKFFFGAPYLDGKHPSLFIGRGIYTKTVMRTYDVVNKELVFNWEWKATSSSDPYYGQGNHNYTISDVDEDGRDEIVWGSMTVDDNGQGLYSTQMGHGDALHVGDLDPFRKGTEIWKCLENSPQYGTILYDGATGDILIHDKLDRDCGRCMGANISDNYPGAELWGSTSTFSASTLDKINAGGSVNFRIFWDGDLLDELLDHTNFTSDKGYGTGSISKPGKGNILIANGATSCNYTKGTPTLQADLFGDWREEVIWRNTGNTAIRIYTTTDITEYRNYTLMHDHQYRQAICWQMCGYNQPPHVSYFLGESEGITVPPPPTISNEKLVYSGSGNWDTSTTNWLLDNSAVAYTDNSMVLFDVSASAENMANPEDIQLELTATVSPKVVTVNSPGNFSLNGEAGKLSGTMQLVKQGLGDFTLTGSHDYSGSTEIWNGSFILNGELTNCPLTMEMHSKVYANGLLENVNVKYGAILNMAKEDSTGQLTITNDLVINEGAAVTFDLHAPDSDLNDSLRIQGNLTFDDNIYFIFNAHLEGDAEQLMPGKYLLAQVSGTINGTPENIVLSGIKGTPAELLVEDGKIFLEVIDVREATTIEWNGDIDGGQWDLATTANFTNNGTADIFVDQDEVVFNDNAANKNVTISTDVTPSSISVEAEEDYTFMGEGKITGNATLSKSGSGMLKVYNQNEFTGKVSINEGTVVVKTMPTNQASGPLGLASSDASLLEINGGTLSILSGTVSDRAVTIGANGGTINNSAQVEWNETIKGGILSKTGGGRLILSKRNSLTKTILKSGVLELLGDEATPGSTISLEGGTLQCSDNAYSYNTISYNIDVPEGKSATINVDSRGYYTGKLTGAGTLRVNAPWWRTDFNGNMSEFEGTLDCYSAWSSDTPQLRLNHSSGLPKATVIIHPGLAVFNESGSSMIFGALAGNGTLDSNESYQVGSKGIDSEFTGKITAGSLKKVGAGTFTLSNSNSYSGGTTISGGKLEAANTSGSATGTGKVTVASGGTLTGKGTITGLVDVLNGGILAPGTESVGNKLTVNNSVNFKSGSILAVKSNPLFRYVDGLEVSGSININGILEITNTSTKEYSIGDEYKLFDCASINGTFESIVPETPGENLKWDLSLLNSDGIIAVAEKVSVVDISDRFSYYPNPVNDVLTIQSTESVNGNFVLSINDLAGRKLQEMNISGENVHHIDVSALPEGVYFVELKQSTKVANFRIIKQ